MDMKISRFLKAHKEASDRIEWTLFPSFGALAAFVSADNPQCPLDNDERLVQLNSFPEATEQDIREFSDVFNEKGVEYPFNLGEVRKLQVSAQERNKWDKELKKTTQALLVRIRHSGLDTATLRQ
ncbi:hypothetical protein FOVSG1_015421 [Fusarium oxysporum f. sp. vasinfectum]